jgi:hypothetical protein
MSTNPKRLALAKFIITDIRVNTATKRLEGNIGECNGGGSVTARGRCGGGRYMGLLSVASVYSLNVSLKIQTGRTAHLLFGRCLINYLNTNYLFFGQTLMEG